MRIAATTMCMEAARTYTEVSNIEIGIRQGNAPTFWQEEENAFLSRFRSIITTDPEQSSLAGSPGSLAAIEPSDRPNNGDEPSPALESFAAQVTGQPLRILANSKPAPAPSPLPGQEQATATIFARMTHVEEEEVLFSARGAIETEDGSFFSFSLDLSMERRTCTSSELMLRNTQLLDPLVLNLEEGLPGLGETSFLFDLNGDGRDEALPSLRPGCGFLVLDRNSDGIINSGRELFGPLSGDGFAELAAFDEDGNLWIDENDPIFSELSIWREAGGEEQQLVSLAEAGVGAIALSHAGTSFNLLSGNHDLLGQVSASGLFLTEAGEVRSLQEIDLAMGELEPAAMETVQDRSQPIATKLNAIAALRFLAALQRMRLRIMMAREQIELPAPAREEHLTEILTEMQQERERSLLEIGTSKPDSSNRNDSGRTIVSGTERVPTRLDPQSVKFRRGDARLLQDIFQPLVALQPAISLDKRRHSS